MAAVVKFCRLRSSAVFGGFVKNASHFQRIQNHPRAVLFVTMPPKRKAAAAKPQEKPVEEAPGDTKKTRGGKNLVETASEIAPEVAGANGESKPKRGRQTKAAQEAEPKATRGKKAEVDKEEREETPPVESKVKKGRARKAAKEPTPEQEQKEVSAEPRAKRGKNKKASTPKMEEDEAEPELEKPKSRSRAKKDVASTSKDDAPMNKTETSYDKIDFSCNKENKLGQKPNFTVACWNVSGLRAWLKKDGLKYMDYEKPDVFCIQEAKCSEDKLPPEIKNLDGYKQFWHNSDKEGYAGIGLFSRPEPLSVAYGIGVPEHDDEGRCITAEYDKFYIINVYVPNAGRKLVTLPKRLEWNKAFKSYVKELDRKKPVIVCGDMNVAHNEIDLANPKTNTKNAGFTKEEREGMTAFLADGYVDTYRNLYPDKTGAYTFWTYMMNCRAKNVGWRLDYFIVSERLIDNVCDNIIRSEVLGSDHCPIALFLNV